MLNPEENLGGVTITLARSLFCNIMIGLTEKTTLVVGGLQI
jgi:hypothetical protein